MYLVVWGVHMGDETTKLVQNMAQLGLIFYSNSTIVKLYCWLNLKLFQFLLSNVMSILRETQWEPDSCRNKWAN